MKMQPHNKKREVTDIAELGLLSFKDRTLSAHDVFSFCMNSTTCAEAFVFRLTLMAFLKSTELQEQYTFKEHISPQQAHRAIAYDWLTDRLQYVYLHGMRQAAERYPEVRQVADEIKEEAKAKDLSPRKERSGLSRRSLVGGLFCMGGTAAIGYAGVERYREEIDTVDAVGVGVGGVGSIGKGVHEIALDIMVRDFVTEIGKKLSNYIERDANKVYKQGGSAKRH